MRSHLPLSPFFALVAPLLACGANASDAPQSTNQPLSAGAPAHKPSAPVGGTPFYGAHATVFADVDGDGRADGVAFDEGTVWVALSNGSGFSPPVEWGSFSFHGTALGMAVPTTVLADVDGDMRADGIAIDDAYTWVTRSTDTGFTFPAIWGTPYDHRFGAWIADVSGDGRADSIASYSTVTFDTWVAPSTGASFEPVVRWSSTRFYGEVETVYAGVSASLDRARYVSATTDVNGDGKADGVAVNLSDVWVVLSNGAGFDAPAQWLAHPFFGTVATRFADVNGDGRADGVAFNSQSTWVMLSNGAGFDAPARWSSIPFDGYHGTFLADVDGDGNADAIAVDDDSTWVMLSTGSGFRPPARWL